MKHVSVYLFVCGIALIAAGMVTPSRCQGLCKLDDVVLEQIMVSGNCEKCHEPEPSCISKMCYHSGSDCREWDDCLFSEDNYCEPNQGTVCAKSDEQACYARYRGCKCNYGGAGICSWSSGPPNGRVRYGKDYVIVQSLF